jgi:hypothetical protein
LLCGQGEIVKVLIADGYHAVRVDVSPEQVDLVHLSGLERIRHSDYRDSFAEGSGQFAAATTTNRLERLTKNEVLDTLYRVARALIPGGVFIARVPSAISPLGGHIRYGDFTHQSCYTERIVQQLAAEARSRSVACRPAHRSRMASFPRRGWHRETG